MICYCNQVCICAMMPYLSHNQDVEKLVNKYGFTAQTVLKVTYYYNKDMKLQFSCRRVEGDIFSGYRWFDENDNKMYNREFKRYVKNLVKRLDELVSFW